jgi:hypothetical protein
VRRYAKLGWPMSVSTAADQGRWAALRLQPLWKLALEQCVASKIMQLDGTSMPALDAASPKGLRLGSIWGYVGHDGHDGEDDEAVACMVYASTGKKTKQAPLELGPEDVLAMREGYVVADASNVFDASFSRAELIECGCNVHARRYFKKALDGGDLRAARPLGAFKRLYIIEAELEGLSAEAKHAARQARSRPVYEVLVEWCETHEPHEPPKSEMGRAIRYLLNHRAALMRFLDDGHIPPDNSAVERLHVRTALTRKNFLFVGSDEGGRRAAIIYTMLACCAIAEVDAVEYLADVLPRLGEKLSREELVALMPAEWKRRRQLERAA